ncbi:uncharacterized protein LOC116427161 [Nomia melanderi]|uniref:uncharacterized protein LOC116427161 n=1 Tax=Nomia melanderi TaxID=2448451 RepID=UPI0013046065|nr:uncharacterized protein LOC116427161 [Nomia melanderi]XP_031833027.1 uncharacterized protein LOC116427161 [Nomia melanderi]XP_031833028.1 uncharacterized protein LOC116427161 [Nomia melanderi]XP_031833029.1 uncharacterized protein LOC116427161 [Nomia melanderi]XP_031833030.1 uncharacterized protein LOC116427161 [Nomia melanderi]XP_031833031.1 uncharacterized protein LOC116427161 [Nomia melanderi]XP_031833032.1 uncharacterized protein LOC116427161 [Nomia melanderi]
MLEFKLSTTLLLVVSSISFIRANIANWEACGGRLERALDALHRDSSRRNRLENEESGASYQQELRSAPLEMSVSRIAVKLPQGARDVESPWARVEKCVYEPNNNSLQTRVMFNDLSVSGLVSLVPRDHQPPIPAESCRMSLRLRRAGIDFLTSPIARGRGQMRIRTESSFLEPRFASIYAYGCHTRRLDKQIKRQDKWPPFYHPPRDEINTYTTVPLIQNDDYDAAEPRQLIGVSKEVDVVIPNETRHSRFLSSPVSKLGIWRKNVWLTKSPPRDRRSIPESNVLEGTSSVRRFPGTFEIGQEAGDQNSRISRSMETITPKDFATALSDKRLRTNETNNCTDHQNSLENKTESFLGTLDDNQPKNNFKRENNYQNSEDPKETRQIYPDENLDSIFSLDLDNDSRGWQSKEHVAREMEDVFLRGASQALTRFIERQLHPAIKETLMISMGYTISYG